MSALRRRNLTLNSRGFLSDGFIVNPGDGRPIKITSLYEGVTPGAGCVQGFGLHRNANAPPVIERKKPYWDAPIIASMTGSEFEVFGVVSHL